MDVSTKAVGFLLALLVTASGVSAASPPIAPIPRPPALDFGRHEVGTRTAAATVRIDNPTTTDLQLTPVSTLPDYVVKSSGCRGQVPPGGWCTIAIRFSPLAAGPRTGQLRVIYPAGQVSVELTGTGVAPELGVSPSRLWFPFRSSGRRGARQAIVLTNYTGRPLTIRSVTVDGDFGIAAPEPPWKLPSGAIRVLPVWRRSEWNASRGTVTILSDASENPQSVSLAADDPGLGCDWLGGADLLFAAILCFGYWLAMVAVRWERVAMATRGDLRGEIHAVKAELAAMAKRADEPIVAAAAGLLREAGDLLDGPKDKSSNKALNILFWSRGQEINGWGYVHEAQIRMVPLMDSETVRARLESAEQRLRLADDTCSTALADAIHTALVGNRAPSVDRMKALLAQALAMNYHREDTVFSGLVSWQNKTSWLVVCGLSAIVALTAIFPQQDILLLVGAAGGLISRLSRSLDRKDVPTDYGASWTTLFLSPVAGAVGAWAGIMVAALAANAKILGPIFQADWEHPAGVGTLAVALIFGFSERLLDSVLDKLNGQAVLDGAQGGTLSIPEAVLADGTVGEPYGEQLQATGATGKLQWSLGPGSKLPAGLSLDSASGKISGKPTQAGTFPFTVEAVDQKKGKASRTLTLTVKPQEAGPPRKA